MNSRPKEGLQMKYKIWITLSMSAASVLVSSSVASAQVSGITYQQIDTITVPGGLTSFDISWVDPANQRFYLTDRTSKKGGGRIDVIDTQANKLLYTIPTTKSEIGFSGSVPTVTPGCSISG